MSLSEKLLANIKVDAQGCFLWQKAIGTCGYGKIRVDKHDWIAHRLAYEVWRGPIPPGLCVCHECDIRRCINPAHLFLGTPKDNISDARTKGRLAFGDRNGSHTHPEKRARGERNGSRLHPEKRPRGERNTNAKLTLELVSEIRRRYANGEKQRKLAREFGVSQATLNLIVRNLAWRSFQK